MPTLKPQPIIFSGAMMRALIAGQKTQTRRIANVTVEPGHDNIVRKPSHPAPYLDAYCGGKKSALNPRGMTDNWCWWTRDDRPSELFRCPYGKPGGLLWVRETIYNGGSMTFDADGVPVARPPQEHWNWTHPALRVPSLHMPRWASRLTLEITEIRIERVQSISAEDAEAEGVAAVYPDFGTDGGPSAVSAYRSIWNGINGPKAWAQNPWVWALTFRVHHVNVDAFARSSEAA